MKTHETTSRRRIDRPHKIFRAGRGQREHRGRKEEVSTPETAAAPASFRGLSPATQSGGVARGQHWPSRKMKVLDNQRNEGRKRREMDGASPGKVPICKKNRKRDKAVLVETLEKKKEGKPKTEKKKNTQKKKQLLLAKGDATVAVSYRPSALGDYLLRQKKENKTSGKTQKRAQVIAADIVEKGTSLMPTSPLKKKRQLSFCKGER